MKLVLVFEDLFFSFLPYRIWTRVSGLESAKNRFLVIWYSDTPSSPSSFMTCPSFQESIAHNVKSTTLHVYIIYGILLLYKSKTLVQIQAVGHERKKIGPQKQGQSPFLRTHLSAFMTEDYLGLCRRSWFTEQRLYWFYKTQWQPQNQLGVGCLPLLTLTHTSKILK